MDWITPNIALWEYPSSKTDLNQFDAILNLDRYTPYQTSTAHTRMPILDGPGNLPSDIVLVVRHLRDLVANGRVLVHCAAGVSRSPFIIALYLAWTQEIEFTEALKLVAQGRRRPLNIDHGLLAISDDTLSLLGDLSPNL